MSAPSAVQTPSRPKMDTKTMVSIAMLTGIAYIVMLLSKLMPSVMFLDFDFKDVVVCIGGFTFGPFAAAIISILVAFIEMHTISHTGPIGFIMNVLVAVMLLWNYLITPLYMTGYSRADVAGLLPTLFLPFNLAKGGMNMAATLLLYPPVVSAMRRAGVVPSSQSTQEKRINAGFVLFALSLLATFVVFALVLAGVI